MNQIKHFLNVLFTKKYIGKIVAYALLILVFYVFSDFLGIFLLTFVFWYLFLSLAEFLKAKTDLFLDKRCKVTARRNFLKKILPLNSFIIGIYIIFIGIIVFIVGDLVPKLINELSELPKTIPFLAEPVSAVTNYLVELKNFKAELWGSINQIVTNQDLAVVMDILKKLKSASVIFMQILVSLILSLVFLLDRFRLNDYLKRIKKSSFSFLYKEYKIIFEKIVKSFGLIFKAQAMIALVNAILTSIWLVIIWLAHGGAFPYLLTLWLIVFIAGFIPVLWVFISSIPILIVAFTAIGWYTILLEIVLLITIIHMIEAYYLNPKILSRFLEIPVSLTFIILIISEHFFGIAWLLIWVSLFYFIVGLLRDMDRVIQKKHKKVRKITKRSTVSTETKSE